jgi:heat shock protein HslJ
MRRALLAVALASLLSACAASGPSLDAHWRLVAGELDGQAVPIVAGHPVTLELTGHQAGGRSACNFYGAQVTYGDRSLLGGVSIRFTDISQTLMGCEARVAASERAFHQALARVDSASRSGDRLVLSGPGVRLEFQVDSPEPD